MIKTARLNRIAEALTPAPVAEMATGDPAIDSALTAGLAGFWTWDDARLMFGPTAEHFTRSLAHPAVLRRDSRRAGQTRKSETPMSYAVEIGSYRPDEKPPEHLASRIESALLASCTDATTSEIAHGIVWATRTEAIMMMLMLGTPDGAAFRRKVWRNET